MVFVVKAEVFNTVGIIWIISTVVLISIVLGNVFLFLAKVTKSVGLHSIEISQCAHILL